MTDNEYADRLPCPTGPLATALEEITGLPSDALRLGSLSSGAFRQVSEVFTAQGDRTGLVVKRQTERTGNADDRGNETERRVYAYVADHAPDLLRHFPVLYWTEDNAEHAIHERVRVGTMNSEQTPDTLSHAFSERCRFGFFDLHEENYGRRHNTRGCYGETVLLDYGHVRDTARDRVWNHLPHVLLFPEVHESGNAAPVPATLQEARAATGCAPANRLRPF